jgi:hypothetical protein
MRTALPAFVLLLLLWGCGGEEAAAPYEDFPVIAQAASGDMVVYLCEAHRAGKHVSLFFRYRDTGMLFLKTGIECTEIIGGFETKLERRTDGGWVELRCETDYPAEAAQLSFVLRMCEEPTCDKADVTHSLDVPAAGETARPSVAVHAGGTTFSVETVAHLRGDSWPQTDGQPGEGAVSFPYGKKTVVVNPGDENTLVVVCKAVFHESIPVLPRGYSETDQILVTNSAGRVLGGPPKAASDVGAARYYAKVSVSSTEMPLGINVCFFAAETLASLRREFAFCGLPNPRD